MFSLAARESRMVHGSACNEENRVQLRDGRFPKIDRICLIAYFHPSWWLVNAFGRPHCAIRVLADLQIAATAHTSGHFGSYTRSILMSGRRLIISSLSRRVDGSVILFSDLFPSRTKGKDRRERERGERNSLRWKRGVVVAHAFLFYQFLSSWIIWYSGINRIHSWFCGIQRVLDLESDFPKAALEVGAFIN